MDNKAKKTFEASRVSQQLEGKWRIWEGFQGKPKKDSSYSANMAMIFPVEELYDLGYLFKNTSYGKPSDFFYDLKDQTVKKYRPLGFHLKVSD